MKCWNIYKKDSGELVSIAHNDNGKVKKKQVVADPLPDHLGVLEMNRVPDLATEMWDATARKFKPRPPRIPTRREMLAQKDPAALTEHEKVEIMQYAIGRLDPQ